MDSRATRQAAGSRRARLILVIFLSLAGAMPALAQPPLTSPPHASPGAVETDSTRLFFAPTGRALPAGHGYAGVWEVVLPVGQVGVTDRISVGGAIWPWAAEEGPIFFVSPKVQVFRSGSTAVSVGAFGGFASGEGGVVIPFASATFGQPSAAFTACWFGPSGGGSLDPGVAVLGFEARISDRMRFISENWILVAEKAGLAIAGVRMNRGRLSADFGLGVIVDDSGDVLPTMVMNFVFRF